MSLIKDWAKAYASAGWPVLQVYAIVDGVCACGKPEGSQACNPGKHPLFGSAGVSDATTDLDEIDAWPEENINVGVAGRDTFIIIDIDHDEASEKVTTELKRRGAKGMARSGGGTLHHYVQCAPTKNGVIMRADGVKLGEVRAANYFVVAAPSNHISGGYYEWDGPSVVEAGPEVTQLDGWAYAKDLFKSVGTEIKDKNAVQLDARAPAGGIEIVSVIPFATSDSNLISMMQDSYPVGGDRSDELFKLACTIVREITFIGKVIDVDERTGTARLKREVAAADEMALDARSTKTARVRKENPA